MPDWKRFSGATLLGLAACNTGDETLVTGIGGPDPNGAGGSGNVAADAGDSTLDPSADIDAPAAPRLMPPEGCPSQRFEHGVCQPTAPIGPGDACSSLEGVCPALMPSIATWSCPLGWHAVAPLPDEAANDLQLQGLQRFTVCAPASEVPCEEGANNCPPSFDGCPSGVPWPVEATLRLAAPGFAGVVLYVDPLAAGPGDGSRANPFTSVASALALATDGAIVAIGRGDNRVAPLQITSRIALVGGCTNQARIVAQTSGEDAPTLALLESGVRLAELTVAGARPGIVAGAGISASLDRVRVSGSLGAGVTATGVGAQLSLIDVFVGGTELGTGTAGGVGVSVSAGATATLERVALFGNARQGLSASGNGSSVNARDLLVADTSDFELVEEQVFAVGVTNGATLTLRSAALIGNRNVGLSAEGSLLDVEDTLVAGSFSLDGLAGFGAYAGESASFDGARVLLYRNQYGAGFGPIATFEIADLSVLETAALSQGQFALFALDSVGSLQRVNLRGNGAVGALLAGSEVDVSDLSVSGTVAVADDAGARLGFGLRVFDNVLLNLERAAFDANEGYSLEIVGTDADVRVSDLSVSGAVLLEDPYLSGGLWLRGDDASTPTTLLLERARFRNNAGSAISAGGPGAELDMSDVELLDTLPVPEEARGALTLYEGIQAIGSRIAISNSADSGISLFEPGTRFTVSDLSIADTFPYLGTEGTGQGLTVFEGSMTIDRSAFVRNAGIGVWVADGADVVLRDAMIEDTLPAPRADGKAIGLNTFAASRLLGERVWLRGNHGVGLSAAFTPEVTLSDFISHDNRSGPTRLDGRGLEVAFSSVSLERASFVRNRDYAVVLIGQECGADPNLCFDPSTLSARHVLIADTDRADCASTSCLTQPGGGGLAVIRGSVLNIEDFDIRSSAVVGLQVLGGSQISARRGLITANEIGVNAQDVTLDEADFVSVRVNGNTIDRDTQDLPVPRVSNALEQLTGPLE